MKNIKMTSGYDVFEPDVRRSNATHRWQSFLFDTEFQVFLKGLLGMCRIVKPDPSRPLDVAGSHLMATNAVRPFPWRQDLLQMLLTFLFDVLLYSNERPGLAEWVETIESIMSEDLECARTFAHRLALKSAYVSGNWLRTYLLDCPDPIARKAAVRVFTQTIQSCLLLADEQAKLEGWTKAWRKQISDVQASGFRAPVPCYLKSDLRVFENMEGGSSSASAIGAILSLMNELIDDLPRCYRFSPELCLFIRNLSSTDLGRGGELIRDAMIQCLLPPRLICLVAKHGTPPDLKLAFPAASVSLEVAETQTRHEQSPHSHQLMPMGNNQVLTTSEMNYRGGNSFTDYISVFEAIGCLMNIPGFPQADLIAEHDDQGRGRQRILLTEPAMQALRDVFQESCAEGAPGMGQREIQRYLHRSGVDNVSPQKIMDMMAKYPTTTTTMESGNGSKGMSYLSLEGFLAYYRDSSQSNEARVSNDFEAGFPLRHESYHLSRLTCVLYPSSFAGSS